MSNEDHKPHVFPHLTYDVSLIRAKLNAYYELDCFMFLPYFDGQKFELRCYPHGNRLGSTGRYIESYYDCDKPDPLQPYEHHTSKIHGPVILAPNGISKAEMLRLIELQGQYVDYLIFVPKTDEHHVLMYDIYKAVLRNGTVTKIEDDPSRSNPSPPATIESIGEQTS